MAYSIQNIEFVGMGVLEGICAPCYLGRNLESPFAAVKMRNESAKLPINGGTAVMNR
jgi:hypothetical protein